ncbi:hypothetical protein [Catellatospora vulcania]|uniref:hypothetical protein n=1 Tax=Catellatospora vulcania TaxID=1460450 RepID=UPI0012D4B6FE|nr:hypothetical protein [Catellatospora vulcania]
MKAAPTTRAIVAAAVLGAVLAPAAPAAAAADPLVTLEQQTSTTDTVAKTVVVSCPDESWVFAVGGWVNGSTGRVLLTRLEPAADLRSATVSARPRTDSAVAFSVTAQVICARTVVPPTRVDNTTMQGSSIEVVCPKPTVMLGFGFRMDRRVDSWRIDELLPDGYLSQVSLHASGSGTGGALTAYGICHTAVDLPGAFAGVYRASSFPVTGSTWPKLAPLMPNLLGWTFGIGATVSGSDSHLDGFQLRPFGDGLARADRINATSGLAAPRTPARTASLLGPAEDPTLTTYGARIGTFH